MKRGRPRSAAATVRSALQCLAEGKASDASVEDQWQSLIDAGAHLDGYTTIRLHSLAEEEARSLSRQRGAPLPAGD